jgi:FlaA1/EpsC-like NDP-sugar epimerase
MPAAVYIIGFVLSFCFSVAIRFSYRFMRQVRLYMKRHSADSDKKNVMIIGAGMAGRALITEFRNSEHISDRVACVIDDNPQKRGKMLCGIKVRYRKGDLVFIKASAEKKHSVALGERAAVGHADFSEFGFYIR